MGAVVKYDLIRLRSWLAHIAIDVAEAIMPDGHSRGRLPGKSYDFMSLRLAAVTNQASDIIREAQIHKENHDYAKRKLAQAEIVVDDLRKEKLYGHADKLRRILRGF